MLPDRCRRGLLCALLAATFVAVAALPAHAAPSPRELARIDRLIRYVELQKGMLFVRNGSEYSPDEAARFLRGKLESMGADVATAREFIERIATRSSMSGTPYQVRFSDGRVLPAAQFMGDELKRIEAHPAPATP
jgi:Family of unknown function (DUF5329)